MPEGNMLLAAASTAIATLAAIVAWYQKRHYAGIDRHIEELQGETKLLRGQVHDLFIQLARSERIEASLERVEEQVAKLRGDLYTVRPLRAH